MLKFLQTMLKVLSITLLGLLLFIGVLVFWGVQNPRSIWTLAEKYFLPSDLKVTWNTIDFKLRPEKGLNFYFMLEVTDLSIHKRQPYLDLPVDYLRVEASAFPKAVDQKLVVHEGHLKAQRKWVLRMPAEKSQEYKKEKNPFQILQGVLDALKTVKRTVKIENIDLQVQELLLRREDDRPLTFCGNFVQDQSRYKDVLTFKLCLKTPAPVASILTAQGQLFLDSLESNEIRMKGKVAVETKGVTSTQFVAINHLQTTTSVNSTGSILLRTKRSRYRIRSSLKGVLTSAGADVDLKTMLQNPPGSWAKIPSAHLRLVVPFAQNRLWDPRASQLSLTFPVKMYFVDAEMRPPLTKACQCKIPEVLMAKIEGPVWLANLIAEPPRPASLLKLHLVVEAVDNKLLSLNTAATLEVTKEKRKYLFTPSVDARVQIHSFQGLKNFLEAKKILIPAPFDILEGFLEMAVKGPIETRDSGYTFPGLVLVNTRAPNQVVNVRGEAKVRLARNFKSAKVDLTTIIHDLQLELPPLDPVLGKPRIVLDKRILRRPVSERKGPPPFQVELDVNVKTAKPSAIRLLSPYFDPYLPIDVDASTHVPGASQNQGFIRTQAFNIKYLRRKVHVEKMSLDLGKISEKTFWIEGRLKVQQTQYTVFIEIEGPAHRPQITLSSTPYLPRSEIISVLLYDRTSDQLASGDAETAGNVEAAIMDRAIGLFSLWVFASTPIKGFSYSPSTKMYTATIEVSHDTTASIGTNWETATQVELRKRISRQWMLTASWTPPDEGAGESTKLILQWESRF